MSHLCTLVVTRSARLSLLTLVVLLAATLRPGMAATATPGNLDAWSDWVLHDVRDFGCPILYNADTRRCSYPGRLELELNDRNGVFTQRWTVYRKSTVHLPGNREHWPLEVTLDDRPVSVVARNGHPAITLDEGRYTVRGRFSWRHLPESLAIPPESGLVSLHLEGKSAAQPDIRNGQLWLSDERVRTETARRADIRVFRKITDAAPLRLTTRIELEISGEQRELELHGAVPGGFEPVSIDSRLPARLDAAGRLLLKVRPGRWTVSLVSRLHRETLTLELAAYPAPWPNSEVWVFEARPNLRMVKITRPPGIDASQSALPEEWKTLPAYRMRAGESMVFEQIRRGDPQPEPDRLTLSRDMWLDFSAGGYSVRDRIGGTLSRGWRINAGSELIPGQVTLNGKPQLITRAADGAVGVEVRQGQLDLVADSRIEASVRHVPAVGWDHDISGLSANIHVPPGYRILAIGGADRSPATWLSRWTLLDFFIVLIAAIALSRIHGKGWGLIGLLGFILLWHEPGAPAFIWLNLIATLSIMRATRATRIYPLARSYLAVSALALALLALPFMVDQVRTGIYPQLEHPWQSLGAQAIPQLQPAGAEAPVAEEKTIADTAGGTDRPSSPGGKYRSAPLREPDKLLQDPNARLQTGPGLPEWSWRNYPLTWNGPVEKDQRLSIYLVSPPVNLLLNFLRVFIVLLLAWKLLQEPVREWLPRAGQAGTATSLLLAVLVAGATSSLPDNALAGYPPRELLQELKQRLLEPAQCLPRCAELEGMAIRLDPGEADFSLRAHAAEDLVLPLPVLLNDWTPSNVSIDGEPAQALFRDRNDNLWIAVDKGVHEISIRGHISHLRSLRLDFPLPPHRIDVVLDGWSSDGTDTLSPGIHSLTFTRDPAGGGDAVFDTRSDIPVFARVERHIRLGLDWRAITRVRLESGTALPALLRIPLLEGESVVSDDIRVEDGHVLVSLSEASRTRQWHSALEPAASLTLRAPTSQPWSETWSLEVTPIWHVSYSGIPVIYHQQSGGRWNPEWRPWPGEQVVLTVTRPQGIAGQTTTIDRSLLTLTPGKRATAAQLDFTLRSSQGRQHSITLPQEATLESVSIDGTAVPIRQEGNRVTLPLKPGGQEISLNWKEARGTGWWFASPAVNLGSDSVNARVVIKPGYDRWVLLTGGIRQGPAVQFWGVLIVIVLLAVGLGRIRGTPLKTRSWILLGIGLSTVTPFSALLIAAWILALYARCQVEGFDSEWRFNAMQVALVALTCLALAALFGAVSNGLLGNPDMQIAGNGSSRVQLNWYQDRIGAAIPPAWIISVPVIVYRILMLAWSMWLAFALINWLKWGWGCLSKGRLWMPRRKLVAR